VAITAEGAALTRQHKRQQAAIRAATLRDVLALWPLLNKASIDASAPAYLTAVRALVRDRRRMAALTASAYYAAYRNTEGAETTYTPLMFAEIVDEVLETALRVTGPVAFKRAIANGKAVETASSLALVQQVGAVSRLVLDGGRSTLVGNMAKDRQAVGWQRVTDGNPCHFCAMLASRGAVYRDKRTAGFDLSGERYHDSCGCTVEPMFSYDAPLLPSTQKYSELWKSSTAGKSGKDAISAFRAAMK
jgi:hypothetical protein